MLKLKAFVRDATCSQFASLVLTRTGLGRGSRADADPASQPARVQLQGFMKSDCSLALRYFESVKAALRKDAQPR